MSSPSKDYSAILRQKQAKLAMLRERAQADKAKRNLGTTAVVAKSPERSSLQATHLPQVTPERAPVLPSLQSTTTSTTPPPPNNNNGSSLSKREQLRERMRKQEAQLAMLRRRSALRAQSSEPQPPHQHEREVVCSNSRPQETPMASSSPSPLSTSNRTKELLAMTARRKKEVAGRKRHFSNLEMQRETMKALENASACLGTLP